MTTKYAIITVAGRQVKVAEGEKVQVGYSAKAKAGSKISFSDVLAVHNGKELVLGAPFVKGATVTATFEDHTRADKVIVFKYQNKNHLKKTIGHRQPYSVLKIEKIEG